MNIPKTNSPKPKFRRIFGFLITSLAALFMWPGFASAFDAIPLTIKERANTDRYNEPVTYGVPFAKSSNLLSTANLQVIDQNGDPVNAQFRVMSRYTGTPGDTSKPIRVVLLDFQVASIEANQTLIYYLQDNGSGTSGSDLAIDNADHIAIDTGKLQAKISKTNFNLFDEVVVDGQQVVSSNADDGIVISYQGQDYTSYNAPPTVVEIEENGPMKTVVRARGFFHNSSGVRFIPPLGDVGLEYTVRFMFYRGKSEVKLNHTLMSENFGWAYNEAHPAHNIDLNSLKLKTTLNLDENKTVDFAGLDGHQYNFTEGSYELLQDHQENTDDESDNFYYTIKDNIGTELVRKTGDAQNGRFDGYGDLRDANKGLMVSSRWFWQNWPKGIEVKNNEDNKGELNFYLWPDMPDDHTFVGSWYKTNEMIYDFHGGVDNDYKFKQEVASLKKRLLPLVADEHLSSTDFIDFVPPAEINTDYTFEKGETLQAPIDKWNNSIRAKYHLDYITGSRKITFSTRREDRPFSIKNSGQKMNMYGWSDFGDMPRQTGFGFSALSYNWEYISLIHGIRFQDYDMIEIGEQMARHKADIDIIHDPTGIDEAGAFDEDWFHGAHRYENHAHYKEADWKYSIQVTSMPRGSSHAWMKGIAMQYLLTGDEYYKEVLDQIGEHLMFAYWNNDLAFRKWNPETEQSELQYYYSCKQAPCWKTPSSREVTRGVHLLVDMYRVTGEEKYLNVAKAIFNNSVLSGLEATNNDGERLGYLIAAERKEWCGNNPDPNAPPHEKYQVCDAKLFFEAISTKPFISLYYELKQAGQDVEAQKILDHMERKGEWFRDFIYKHYEHGECGTYNAEGQYFPYVTKNYWRQDFKYPTSLDTKNDMTYSFVQADLFAFLYKEKNDASWLEIARGVFKDGMMYGYPSNSNYRDIVESMTVEGLVRKEGWLKEGKSLHKPMFYLKVEAVNSQIPGAPGNLRIE